MGFVFRYQRFCLKTDDTFFLNSAEPLQKAWQFANLYKSIAIVLVDSVDACATLLPQIYIDRVLHCPGLSALHTQLESSLV